MKHLRWILLLLIVFQASAQERTEESKSVLGTILQTPTKEAVLGRNLKGVLENYHISKKKMGDELSRNAFQLYLEKVDYGKQFLTQKDISKIEMYKNKFDDEMVSGRLKVVDEVSRIMSVRIPVIQKYVDGLLAKDFDFSKNESYETDSKKREYVANEKELKERWRKIIKLDLLSQYLELEEEQNEPPSKKEDKKKKKKKKEKAKKKLSHEELLKEAKTKIEKRYTRVFKRLLEERDSDKLDKFYNSIVNVYDPHTHYFVPEEKEDFDIDMSGQLEGIGALLREEGSYIKVEKIIPGSASWKGKKLQAEDIILGVSQDNKEFVDIVDMSIRDAVKMIRGKKGTTVYLKVRKPEETTEVIAIVRDKVILEESYVKGSLIEHKDLGFRVGYINVPKFYRDFKNEKGRNSSDDVKAELERLAKTDAKAVILDLRNNGGGALVDATLMGGLFIDEGPIVQVKSSGSPDIEYDHDGKKYWDKTLVILINRFSASASEIVAGAMKDYNRAVIVGSSEQTHGKGTVQTILDMNGFLNNSFLLKSLGDMGAIKITTAMFYRINGKSTQFRGVVPHITLPDQFGFVESGERSLDYAIPYDEIDAVKHKDWTKSKYDIDDLKEKSEKRVKKQPAFKKVVENLEWSKKRKEQSVRSLKIDDMRKFRAEAKLISDDYEKVKANEAIVVDPLNALGTKEAKERFEEFRETLQKDPVIEESLYIINDIFKS